MSTIRSRNWTRLAAATVTAVATAASPALATTTSAVRVVPGTGEIRATACPSPTTCLAGGLDYPDRAVLVPVNKGKPLGPEVLMQGGSLTGLACSSASSCVAVGDKFVFHTLQPFVVPISNGVPGTIVEVPDADGLNGLACSTATTCLAVGSADSTEGVVVPITNGVPGAAQVASAEELEGVACSGAACVAVGPHAIVPITGAIPAATRVISESLTAVACTSATTCVAVGQNSFGQSVVVPIANGIPGTPEVVTGATFLSAIACLNAVTCEAVGQNGTDGVVVKITAGMPRSAQVVSGTQALYGVACASPTTCVAGGRNSSYLGVVVAIRERRGGLPVPMPPTETAGRPSASRTRVTA